MKLTAQEIKEKLAVCLQKQGSSIQELETFLAKQAMNKEAGLGDTLMKLPGLGWNGMLLGGAAAAGAGGLAGLGGYAAYKQLQDSDNRIDAKQVEKKQYEDAIRELQRSLAEQQGMHV